MPPLEAASTASGHRKLQAQAAIRKLMCPAVTVQGGKTTTDFAREISDAVEQRLVDQDDVMKEDEATDRMTHDFMIDCHHSTSKSNYVRAWNRRICNECYKLYRGHKQAQCMRKKRCRDAVMEFNRETKRRSTNVRDAGTKSVNDAKRRYDKVRYNSKQYLAHCIQITKERKMSATEAAAYHSGILAPTTPSPQTTWLSSANMKRNHILPPKCQVVSKKVTKRMRQSYLQSAHGPTSVNPQVIFTANGIKTYYS